MSVLVTYKNVSAPIVDGKIVHEGTTFRSMSALATFVDGKKPKGGSYVEKFKFSYNGKDVPYANDILQQKTKDLHATEKLKKIESLMKKPGFVDDNQGIILTDTTSGEIKNEITNVSSSRPPLDSVSSDDENGSVNGRRTLNESTQSEAIIYNMTLLFESLTVSDQKKTLVSFIEKMKTK